MSDPDRNFLRHTVATLSYRCAKCVADAPIGFPTLQIAVGARTPVQILAHMGDLFDWALTLAEGTVRWSDSPPLPWAEECWRFFAALKRFDERLAASGSLACSSEQLFQGPIADALTHTGQLALLRRLVGSPIRGENYAKATIERGQIGPVYTTPRSEF